MDLGTRIGYLWLMATCWRTLSVFPIAWLLTQAAYCQADPATAAAARAGVALAHVVPFDGKALPAIESLGFRTTFDRMCFQGDSTKLFVGTMLGASGKYAITAIDLAEGKASPVEYENTPQLVGGSPSGPLLRSDSAVVAPAEAKWSPFSVPARADVFLSPFGPQAVVCALGRGLTTSLVDLSDGKSSRIALGTHHPSAVAFHPSGRVAIARAQFAEGGKQKSEGILVLGKDGTTVAKLPPAKAGVAVLAFSADGEHLYYVDDALRRVALATGEELAKAADVPVFWAELAPEVAIGCDASSLRMYEPASLARVKEFPLPVQMPEGLPATLTARGPVLAAAMSSDRNWFAVATYEAVSVFRVRRAKS